MYLYSMNPMSPAASPVLWLSNVVIFQGVILYTVRFSTPTDEMLGRNGHVPAQYLMLGSTLAQEDFRMRTQRAGK